MTDVVKATESSEQAAPSAGLFRGVLEITEPNGEKRLVPFEATVSASSLGQAVTQPTT